MKCISRLIQTAMALAALAALPAAAQLPEPASTEEIEREARIMADVIEAGLDLSSVGEWHHVGGGSSPFEPKIKWQYLPSVGVIYSFSVNFPLIDRDSADDQEEEEELEAPGETDLWERHESGAVRPGPAGGPAPPIPPAPPRPGQTIINGAGISEIIQGSLAGVTELLGQLEASNLENLEHDNEQIGEQYRNAFRNFRFSFSNPGAVVRSVYNEDKVLTLRNALIGVVARYGHRLEHLPESEKVIIIAESPSAQAVVIPGSGFRPYTLFEHDPDFDTDDDDRDRERGRRPRPSRADRSRGQHARFTMRASSDRDRYMISVPKSEILERKQAEEIVPAVVEYLY